MVFVDLRKAYNGVDWTTFFGALYNELGVAPGVIAMLGHMYADVQAQVLRGSELSISFPVRLGVLQSCPSSPAVLSLFIDRLESFLGRKLGSVNWHHSGGGGSALCWFTDPVVIRR